MPFPLLAALAIQGGASLLGGLFKKNAAKDAGKIQAAAAERVGGINRGVYQDQMAGMEPYAALGRASANRLGRLTTPGVPYTPDLQMRDAAAQYNAMPSWSMTPGEDPNASPHTPRLQARMAAAAPQQPPQPQMVRLRSPNGSIRMIPADQAEGYIRRGAVRA